MSQEFDIKDTKEMYTSILHDVKQVITEGSEGMSQEQYAELFGLYYNAFAGILRTGAVLHKKEMDLDGYARIEIQIGNESYVCKDTAIRDIFQTEYNQIISPYEDNSKSYVHVYEPKMIEVSNGNIQVKKTEKAATKEKKKPEVAEKKKTSLFGSKTKAEKKSAKPKKTPEEKAAEKAAMEAKKAEERERRKQEQLAKREAKKQKKPESPSSYQDQIPRLMSEIDSISSEISTSLIGTGVAAAGIVLSLVLL